MKRLSVMVLLLILVAFGLRVWNLSSQSVWWDEAFTVHTAGGDWNNFWHQLQTGDRHPPLYYLSVRGWGSVAGWSEFSLRFLSLMYGVIGLAFLYKLTVRLFGSRAGGFALAAAVFSPALIVYSQEGRMYELFFMLTAATLYFGLRSTECRIQNTEYRIRNSQYAARSLYVALLLVEAALLLTHYFAVPLIAAFNLLVLIGLIYRKAKTRVYLKWLGGQVIATLPVLVWVIGVASTPGNLIKAGEAPPDLFSFTWQVLALWSTGIRSYGLDPVLLTSGLIILAAIGAVWVNRRMAWLVIAFGLVSFVLAFAVTSAVTSFHPRYMLSFSLPLFVLIGGALSNLITHKPSAISRLVLGVLVLGVAAWSTSAGWNVANDPANAKDDARSVAAYLKAHASADDVILFEDNDYTLSYYAHGPASIKMISAQTEADALKQMSGAIGNTKHVWLTHWKVSTQDPRDYWRFLLEQSGRMTDWTSYQGYELYRYEMQSPLHEPRLDAHVLYDSGEQIGRWSGVDGQGADGALTFAVEWLPDNPHGKTNVSVRLLDSAGQGISAIDVPMLDENGRASNEWTITKPITNYYVLPIPIGTPPLTYTLVAQRYILDDRESVAPISLGTVTFPRRLDTADPYRTLAGYQWESTSAPEILGGLELEAFAIGDKSPGPMQPIDVALRWRKTGAVSKTGPRLRIVQGDRVWAETGSDLLEREYPIEQWAEGEMVIDRRRITYPPIRGPMQLQVGQGDQWTPLTTLQLSDQSMSFTTPAMQHTQVAQFGDFAKLEGFELNRDFLSFTQPIYLKLYWHATNTELITTSYTVFTQILAPDGHLVAQQDAPPRPPTMQWVPGQIVDDVHTIEIVDPTYRGPATLIVGWYNSATVQRVPVQSGGDYVTLQTPIQVKDQ